MPKSNVAAVILAAGESARFGSPKQLLEWEGRPLVTHTANTAWLAGLDPVIVVLGAMAEQITPALQGHPVRIVRNYRWHEGMSTSLSAGLSVLSPEIEAAVFLPVDQPLITTDLLCALVSHWQQTGARIVVPATQVGKRGNPVLFAREFFPELACLTGDVGGRAIFAKYADRLVYLPVSDANILVDVDTPEAYRRLREEAQCTKGRLDFEKIRGIVCDMDGVLWRGQTPLPGLHAFFALIDELDLGYILVTNNSSKTPQMYVDKLNGMGIQITPNHILTSALAAADHLTGYAPVGALVYPIGGAGVLEALRTRGFRISEGDQADYVVVGWDQGLTWQKLALATRLILHGAGFVGTNPDLTFPMENALAPGNGAQLAALEAATGVEPVVLGKPFPGLYQQALTSMGTRPEDTLVIGDRLDTDILGGLRLGMPTAMLLSGVSDFKEVETSPIRPNMTFEDLSALVRAWRAGMAAKKQGF